MKKSIFYSLLFLSILQSCGTSSNVTSNFSIQKRKYTKGWNVNDLFRSKQKNDKAEVDVETNLSQQKNEPLLGQPIETATRKEITEEKPFLSKESNDVKHVDQSVIPAAANKLDGIDTEQETHTSEAKELERKELENISDSDPEENNSISPALHKFNIYHKIIVWMFIISMVSIFAAIFTGFSIELLLPFIILSIPMYVLVIKQRFKNAVNVPKEEHDMKFERKRSFAATLFVLGTIIAVITVLLGIVAFISVF